jgi:uncharacterized RDD family membrane protein YckC
MGFYDAIPHSTANDESQVVVSGHRYLGGEEFASWHRRAVSFLIDLAPLWALMFIILPLYRFFGLGQSWQTAVTWIFLAATVLSLSGQGGNDPYKRSMGHKFMGLVVVRPIITPQGAQWMWCKPAMNVAVLRIMLHGLDFISFGLGFLRPLWNKYHQTFADSLTGCVVIHAADPATLDIAKPTRGVWVTKVNG